MQKRYFDLIIHILLRIKNKVLREFYKFFKYRPSSYPFISGDGFRKMADYIYDETQTFDPNKVKSKSIIFVKSNLLRDFFVEIHPLIKEKYVLISHNSDENIDETYFKYIDEKIIHWFAQNNVAEHEKITPIPIGLENAFYVNNGIKKLYKIHKAKQKKKTKIGFSFSLSTNIRVRTEAKNNLEKSLLAEPVHFESQFIQQSSYVKKASSFAFIASPEGNGSDCHRTWEALYLKSIPIVTKNYHTLFFKSLNIPILIIDSWKDIQNLSKATLENEYGKYLKNDTNHLIFFPYWKHRIEKYLN